VSNFPNLKSLQLTYTPYNDVRHGSDIPDQDISERCRSHQNFATEFLRRLTWGGSPIVFISFKPSSASNYFKHKEILDDNEHCSPRYYYSQGDSSTTKLNGHIVKQVVAVPVKENDILDFIRPELLFESDLPESYCPSVKWYQEHK